MRFLAPGVVLGGPDGITVAVLLNIGLLSIPGANVAVARDHADDTAGSVDEQSWSFDSDAEGTPPDGMQVLSQPRVGTAICESALRANSSASASGNVVHERRQDQEDVRRQMRVHQRVDEAEPPGKSRGHEIGTGRQDTRPEEDRAGGRQRKLDWLEQPQRRERLHDETAAERIGD